MPQHRNHLVQVAEEAILTEVKAFYQTAPDAVADDGGGGEEVKEE